MTTLNKSIIIWFRNDWKSFNNRYFEEVNRMLLDENFDADEILRDVDDHSDDEDGSEEGHTRELNFGNVHDENANFNDMAGDLDTTEDLWQ